MFWISFRLFAWLTVLTGIFYPLFVTIIAQFTMPFQANGSFVTHENTVIGSALIAQKFENEKYFWPRPSAIDYNPLSSGGSNLGPTSISLKQKVKERKANFLDIEASVDLAQLPSELLYASGSGLDPHLSVEAAHFQIKRILKARGMETEKGTTILKSLIDRMTQKRCIGVLGNPCVNVLKLNLALDELEKVKQRERDGRTP